MASICRGAKARPDQLDLVSKVSHAGRSSVPKVEARLPSCGDDRQLDRSVRVACSTVRMRKGLIATGSVAERADPSAMKGDRSGNEYKRTTSFRPGQRAGRLDRGFGKPVGANPRSRRSACCSARPDFSVCRKTISIVSFIDKSLE